MEVCKPYSKKEDSKKIEKKGVIKFIAKASCYGEKRQIEAGYDFKVSIISLPSVDSSTSTPAELGKFVLFMRDAKEFLDGQDVKTPKFEVINDTSGSSTVGSGLCYFGGTGGVDGDNSSGNIEYLNTIFKNFNQIELLPENHELSQLTDISMDINSIPYEKVSRWFGSGSDFFKFYLNHGEASFEGINVIESPIAFSGNISYSGYAMVIGKMTIALKGSLKKQSPTDLLYILNVSTEAPASSNDIDPREIRIYENPIQAVIDTLNGPIKIKSSSRKLNVLGAILCNKLKRVDNGKPINGKLVRDPAILFSLKGAKSLIKYSTSLSRTPSYFVVKRYYE
jgi:hypothetical protein